MLTSVNFKFTSVTFRSTSVNSMFTSVDFMTASVNGMVISITLILTSTFFHVFYSTFHLLAEILALPFKGALVRLG